LLWPLDIALRRVSLGRRELGDARRWLGGGWRRSMAPRTTEVAGMLAARDRAAGSASRAALLRGDDPERGTDGAAPAVIAARPAGMTSPARAGDPAESSTSSAWARPASSAPPATPTPSAAPALAAPAPAAPVDPDAGSTLSRLRDAKRRSRER
jgi:hypothetical protein